MQKIYILILFSCAGLFVSAQSPFHEEINALVDTTLSPFCFGVASGDPHPNGMVLWTKLWMTAHSSVSVGWEVAADSTMENILERGELVTDASSAYTVKVFVQGLSPGCYYFYRFRYDSTFSPIGRTKTSPSGSSENVRFAVVSCSNYENGFFNVYGNIALRNDLDAVIHLGDYIYEYATGRYSKKTSIRTHIPAHEILNMQDYRTRYAQYRCDKDLQEVHRLHPFITVWDDHEFANNSYKDGAKNHQEEEGDWEVRKAIARKVYFEWLPVLDNETQTIVRKINYGIMADIFMLDSRLEGRSEAVESPYDTNLQNPNRTMLGREQTNWLTDEISKSTSHWKVIGNQVVFSELDAHKVSKKYALNVDAWDGYPVERDAILDSFYAHQVKNIIIVTGDIHTSWAFDLVKNPKNKSQYNRKTGMGIIGAEFVTPSVSSGNVTSRVPRGLGKMLGGLLKRKATNPHLRFLNVVDHGYILLDLNNERANATWYFAQTVKERTNKIRSKRSWSTMYNNNRLVKSRDTSR